MNMNFARELGEELTRLSITMDSQEIEINKYRLKTAMYKAGFFRRSTLLSKIRDQIDENLNAVIGEFDGFSYSSIRRNAIYRTLEDMVDSGLISVEEYNFCNE